MQQYKAQLRFVIERYSKFELDMLDELSASKPGEGVPFPGYLLLLVKQSLDEGLIGFHEQPIMGMSFNGIRMDPGIVSITDKGRKFMENFKLGKDIGYAYTPEG